MPLNVGIRLYRAIYSDPLQNLGDLLSLRRMIPSLRPKPRQATIAFIDMVSSVPHKTDVTDIWQENIMTLHSRAKKIIRLCHGTVSKTIGDCVMAYFSGKNHEKNAVFCTCALLESFNRLKEYYERDWDSSLYCFPVTIGVASGEVFFLYRRDPFGWPVDLAARLQDSAIEGTACIYCRTFDAVRDTDLYGQLPGNFSDKETVSVKSFGDVEVVRLIMPPNEGVPQDAGDAGAADA